MPSENKYGRNGDKVMVRTDYRLNDDGKFNIVKMFFLICYLFIYIFSPPIVKNTRIILDIINFFIVIVCIFYKGKIHIPSYLKITIMPFVPFLIYVWLNSLYFVLVEKPESLIAYENIDYFRTAFLPMYIWIRLLALCFVLQLLKHKININIDTFADCVLMAGGLQFICALLAFLIPGIRDVFLQIISVNTDGNVQKSIFELFNNDKRAYGFADNLFDSIGYVVSLISTIAFIKTVSRSSVKYFVLFVCTVFIVLVNTRTGLVLDMITVFLITIFYGRKNIVKSIIRFIIALIVMVLVGTFVISQLPESTLSWASEGMESVYALIVEQEYTGIFLTFYLNHLNFPNDIIFGDGAIPDPMYYNVSDMGYVQCIWRYGLVGTVLLMAGWVYFFYSSYKENSGNKELQCFILCAATIFFLYLIKLFSLYNLGGYAVFLPIIIMSLVNKDNDNVRWRG